MDRTQIFLEAAKQLRAHFEELRVVPHSGLKGVEAEGLVSAFLNAHLPERFKAGSGFIVDHKGGVSRQTDVIIYDALNCPVYRMSEGAGVFPSDNVAAVIEVKSTIDKRELTDAWKKIEVIKGLRKVPEPPSDRLVQFHTLGVVFAFECSTTLDTLSKNYWQLLSNVNEFGRHVDLVVVLDQGVLNIAGQDPKGESWIPVLVESPQISRGEGYHLAVSTGYFGKYSLDAFFRVLLGHLMFFRHRIDHPGFDWPSKPKQRLKYLKSVTLERGPGARKARLMTYRQQMEREFDRLNKNKRD